MAARGERGDKCKNPGTSAPVSAPVTSDSKEEEYKVGPGRPPKEYQFKPGQSGNPKGAKKKKQTLDPAIAEILKQALAKKVKLTQGDKTRIVSMLVAGIEQLVAQFAKGDRHARRDVMTFAEKYGVNLIAPQTIKDSLAPNDQAILDRYIERVTSPDTPPAERVIAPPDLLEDDEKPEK
jgi:hypothetical protein